MSREIVKHWLNGRSEEEQYLQLIRDVLKNGSIENGRNGTTKVLVGNIMYFSLKDNTIPLLTTKKVAWKSCLRELLWFIRGETDNTILQKQNVRIWNDNASRDFLDSRGLQHLEENDLGPVYGFQWRHFNAPYKTCKDNYDGQGVDQLQYIVDQLKSQEGRASRRLLMSAWNPCQIDQMALPPCHVLIQFNVTEGNKLNCSLYQRSGDIGLGVPFNIASYSFLTHLIAKHCDLEANEFIYHLGNAHIYDDHFESLEVQVEREPMNFPKLNINVKRENIDNYSEDDFELLDYNCHEPIKMQMRK